MTDAEMSGIEDYYSALPASSSMKRLIELARLGRTVPQVRAEAFAAGAAAMRERCVETCETRAGELKGMDLLYLEGVFRVFVEFIRALPLPTPEDR